jgi:hypothetical protein
LRGKDGVVVSIGITVGVVGLGGFSFIEVVSWLRSIKELAIVRIILIEVLLVVLLNELLRALYLLSWLLFIRFNLAVLFISRRGSSEFAFILILGILALRVTFFTSGRRRASVITLTLGLALVLALGLALALVLTLGLALVLTLGLAL